MPTPSGKENEYNRSVTARLDCVSAPRHAVLAKQFTASPWEAAREGQALLTMFLCTARPGRPLRSRSGSACSTTTNRGASTNYYPRRADRRQRCVTTPNTPGMAQPSVAQFATEGLASYGTTPGEPHFVRRNALTVSRHARTATVVGHVDFTPPDDRGEVLAAIFGSSGCRSKEPPQ
jgi:hypothetical protein